MLKCLESEETSREPEQTYQHLRELIPELPSWSRITLEFEGSINGLREGLSHYLFNCLVQTEFAQKNSRSSNDLSQSWVNGSVLSSRASPTIDQTKHHSSRPSSMFELSLFDRLSLAGSCNESVTIGTMFLCHLAKIHEDEPLSKSLEVSTELLNFLELSVEPVCV